MIELRRFPYPYRAMLAICSDLDETRDRQTYWETMRFLNSTEPNRMGPGVGLEIANTIYFDMPPTQFAYWNTDDAGRHMVRALIRSGHIDGLHSFGDDATTRDHAKRALDELERHDCHLKVWVDHATAPSNFGADIMRGCGDIPGDAAYHADLTCGFGVRYVWRGRVTSVIGQDRPSSVRGLFSSRHPLPLVSHDCQGTAQGRTGSAGKPQVRTARNERTPPALTARDGRNVYEFLRCNPFWGGVGHAATADGLAHALTANVLDRLVQRGGTCILYTHLGKIPEPGAPFTQSTRSALQRLAEEHRAGRILVTTTSRLLDYRRKHDEISLHTHADATGTRVDLRMGGDRNGSVADLHGLTVYAPEPHRIRLTIDGVPVANVQHNSADHLGRASLMLPWPKLELPCL